MLTKTKEKKLQIIPSDTEKAFKEIQCLIRKKRKRTELPQLEKEPLQTPTAKFILMVTDCMLSL